MSQRAFRLLLLTTVCTMAGAFVSCETEPVGPDGNIFLRGSPRYGHGSTERSKYKYGATGDEAGEPGTKPRRDTKYLSGSDERKSRGEDSASDPDDSGSGNSTSESETKPSSSDNGNADVSDSGTSDPPAETKPKPATEDLPYATPVPGKDGHVYSPYTSAGYIDVRGMPSGSKARCPYTKKIFRVP